MTAGMIIVHIVWCTKYRRSVLHGAVAEVVRQALIEKSTELDVELSAIAIMPDHVHVVAGIPKSLSIAEVVRHFKGYSSFITRRAFPELRQQAGALWARRYFACSVGSSATRAIRKYVEQQTGE